MPVGAVATGLMVLEPVDGGGEYDGPDVAEGGANAVGETGAGSGGAGAGNVGSGGAFGVVFKPTTAGGPLGASAELLLVRNVTLVLRAFNACVVGCDKPPAAGSISSPQAPHLCTEST